MRDKFLFGLNEFFTRFREHIFYGDGQRKPDDPPFTLAFVVSHTLSFETAQQTNKLLATSAIEEQIHYATSALANKGLPKPPERPGNRSRKISSYCHKTSHFTYVCQHAFRAQ